MDKKSKLTMTKTKLGHWADAFDLNCENVQRSQQYSVTPAFKPAQKALNTIEQRPDASQSQTRFKRVFITLNLFHYKLYYSYFL